MKSQGVTKVNKIHAMETTNVWTKFYGNLSSSWDISVWAKVMDWLKDWHCYPYSEKHASKDGWTEKYMFILPQGSMRPLCLNCNQTYLSIYLNNIIYIILVYVYVCMYVCIFSEFCFQSYLLIKLLLKLIIIECRGSHVIW